MMLKPIKDLLDVDKCHISIMLHIKMQTLMNIN